MPTADESVYRCESGARARSASRLGADTRQTGAQRAGWISGKVSFEGTDGMFETMAIVGGIWGRVGMDKSEGRNAGNSIQQGLSGLQGVEAMARTGAILRANGSCSADDVLNDRKWMGGSRGPGGLSYSSFEEENFWFVF